MSITTTVTRRTLIDWRESVSRRVLANARTVEGQSGRAPTQDVRSVLSSLPDAGKPSVITPATVGRSWPAWTRLRSTPSPAPCPTRSQRATAASPARGRRRPARRRHRRLLALNQTGSSYFGEVYRLGDIDAGLRTLGFTLVLATALSTVYRVRSAHKLAEHCDMTRIGSEATEAIALGQPRHRRRLRRVRPRPRPGPGGELPLDGGELERIDRGARFASDIGHEIACAR